MRESVSAYDAKTHLAQLLRRVSEGDRITITRHGVPVAVLTPPPGAEKPDVQAALDRMATLRKGRKGREVTLQEIREFIEEGRR